MHCGHDYLAAWTPGIKDMIADRIHSFAADHGIAQVTRMFVRLRPRRRLARPSSRCAATSSASRGRRTRARGSAQLGGALGIPLTYHSAKTVQSIPGDAAERRLARAVATTSFRSLDPSVLLDGFEPDGEDVDTLPDGCHGRASGRARRQVDHS